MRTNFKCCKDKTKKGQEIIVGYNNTKHIIIDILPKGKLPQRTLILTPGTAVKVLNMLTATLYEINKK